MASYTDRLTSRTHSWAGRETDSTRLSNSYFSAVTASAICEHRTKHHVYLKHDKLWHCGDSVGYESSAHTFTAWGVPQSSCRIPKHTTHTPDTSSFSLTTAAVSSSDRAPVALGSSFALLLGGSSGGSDTAASWDLLFPSVDSAAAAASWDLVFSVLLIKAWSSLSVSYIRWKMTQCMKG